jgi:hypothetical protein
MIDLENLRRRQRLLHHLGQLALRGLDQLVIAATTTAAHYILGGRGGNKRCDIDGRYHCLLRQSTLVPLLQREEQDKADDHSMGDERNRTRGRAALHRHWIAYRDWHGAQLERRQLLWEQHIHDAGEQRLPDGLFDNRIQAGKVQSRRLWFPTPI